MTLPHGLKQKQEGLPKGSPSNLNQMISEITS
jgi:hypothetical protein